MSERLMEARQLERHLKMNLDQALSRAVDLEVEAKSRVEVANSLSQECFDLRQRLASLETEHREAEAAREEEKAGREKAEADLDQLAAEYNSLMAEVERLVRQLRPEFERDTRCALTIRPPCWRRLPAAVETRPIPQSSPRAARITASQAQTLPWWRRRRWIQRWMRSVMPGTDGMRPRRPSWRRNAGI